MAEQKEFRHLVRIANTDLKGEKPIGYALRNIKGVGFRLASAICAIAKIDKAKKAGELSEEEIKKLDEVLNSPLEKGMPFWMANRRRCLEDDKDRHLITTDLLFARDNDIKLMKKIRCYKGVRHMLGQPVRGQKTRSHFRKNKGKVMGVKRSTGMKSGKV